MGAALLIMAFLASAVADDYQPPSLEDPLFDVEQIVLLEGARTDLVKALTSLATHADCPPLIRSRALGIALRLDSIYRPAFTANMLLKQGQTPPGDDRFETLTAAAAALADFAKILKGADAAGDDNRLLAAYVLDLAASLEAKNVDYAYELTVLKKGGASIDWMPITGTWQGTATQKTAANGAAATTGTAGTGAAMTRPGGKPPGGGPSIASGAALPRLQSLVKGLLVRPLEANQFAGKVSQMNATARREASGGEMKVGFNQEVGPSMESALGEVIKFLRVRHKGLPGDHRVEIAFEEQYIPKDGPSAAVACALMLESLIEDIDLDPQFAVTGDLNADGSVQPVGGITGKLRGAAAADCTVIGIPSANSRVISDLLIMEGAQALTKIQIFSLETFDEAYAVAVAPDRRSEDVRTSIETFEEVRGVLNRPKGLSYLKNSHVQDRLRKCLKLTPNHLSARFLLLASVGRAPKQLSLEGSLQYIDRSAEPLLRVMRQGNFDKRGGLEQDEFADAASALMRIRTKLDPRVTKFSDAIISYAKLLRTFANDRPKSINGLRDLVGRIEAAADLIGREYDDLHSRVDVQEELMR